MFKKYVLSKSAYLKFLIKNFTYLNVNLSVQPFEVKQICYIYRRALKTSKQYNIDDFSGSFL